MTLLKNIYDTIIIGSGLGGLTAAASLAQNGQKVAVFERHSQPGGYATTFYRDEFEFEVSLHAMSGVGTADNPGPLRPFLEQLGVLEKVNFIPMKDLYRTIGEGVDIVVPQGPDNAKRVLSEAFPHEAKGIESFIDQILTVGEEVQLIRQGNHSTKPLPTVAKFPNLAHSAGMTVAQMLNRYVADEKAKLALGQLWGYFGLPPSELSFLLFAAGVSSYLKWGSVTIEGKSQSLSNAYAEVIQKNGGEIHLAEGVKKIIVENGKTQGIISELDIEYKSNTIISNADPYSTLHRLIDDKHVAPKYKRRLEAATPSAGTVTLYLGLNQPSRSLGIRNHELYLNFDIDMDQQWDKCKRLAPPGVMSVCAYDNSNPSFAPTGKGVIAVTVLSTSSPWTSLSAEQYGIEKARFGQILLKKLDNAFPGVSDAVETQLVSTPITNMRYTGNPGGAIYGFANTPEENPGFRMDNKGPIEGLWFAGAWTRPGAGYQGVITSGINTADAILAEKNQQSALVYGVKTPTSNFIKALKRRAKGWALIAKDGKTVGRVVRSKYRKYDNSPVSGEVVERVHHLASFHAKQMRMLVASKTRKTFDTMTLRLFPKNEFALQFTAGQYVDISATIEGKRITRAYSISSAPAEEKYIEITVKSQPAGKMSSYLLYNIAEGGELTVTGPYGEFSFNKLRDSNDIVAIAAGSGVTPIISMMKELNNTAPHLHFHLIFGSRREEEILFRDELKHICDSNKNFSVCHILSSPSKFWSGLHGRISTTEIDKLLPERLDQKTFFICGPEAMRKPVAQHLKKNRNVPGSQIIHESFNISPHSPCQSLSIFQNRKNFIHPSSTSKYAMCHRSDQSNIHKRTVAAG